MKRTMSRLKAMMKLYSYDLTKELLSDDYLESIFNEESIDCDNDFYHQLVVGVLENIDKIDRTIAISLKNYTLDRLSYVDRNLIKLLFTMLFTKTRKHYVNEILNLSRV